MDNLNLLDIGKPDKVKDTFNELIECKRKVDSMQEINKETLGLNNVDNTSDIDKPLSSLQKEYIDNENEKDLKLYSDEIQKVNSDIALKYNRKIYAERGNEELAEIIDITNENAYETLNLGSSNIPLKLRHTTKDINGSVVSKNPKIEITDEFGNVTENKIAFISDISASKTNIKVSELLTLYASNWSGNSQSVSVNNLSTVTRNVIDVDVDSVKEWAKCGVLAVYEVLDSGSTDVESTTIIFNCDTVPTNDLHFYVTSMEVE